MNAPTPMPTAASAPASPLAPGEVVCPRCGRASRRIQYPSGEVFVHDARPTGPAAGLCISTDFCRAATGGAR